MLATRRWMWMGVSLLGCSAEVHSPRDAAEANAGEVRDAEGAGDRDVLEPPSSDASALDPTERDASAPAAPLAPDPADVAPVVDASAAAAPDAFAGDAGSDAGAAPPLATPGCLAAIRDFQRKGPFAFRTESVSETIESDQTLVRMDTWIPMLPAGCRVPVVHFARGTGGTCALYAPILEHLASHGFLVVCHQIGTTGDGTRCLSALTLAYQKYADVADAKIASMGDGEGGAGAYSCLQRAEGKWQASKLYVGFAMSPDSGLGDDIGWQQRYAKIRSPVFQFHGSESGLISESVVRRSYDALGDTTEAYWYVAQGAREVTLATRWAQEAAVAFFRWKLLGDNDACQRIKSLPQGDDWDVFAAQASQDCLHGPPIAERR